MISRSPFAPNVANEPYLRARWRSQGIGFIRVLAGFFPQFESPCRRTSINFTNASFSPKAGVRCRTSTRSLAGRRSCAGTSIADPHFPKRRNSDPNPSLNF